MFEFCTVLVNTCDLQAAVHEVVKAPGSSRTHHTIIVLLTNISLSAVPVDPNKPDAIHFLHTLKLYGPFIHTIGTLEHVHDCIGKYHVRKMDNSSEKESSGVGEVKQESSSIVGTKTVEDEGIVDLVGLVVHDLMGSYALWRGADRELGVVVKCQFIVASFKLLNGEVFLYSVRLELPWCRALCVVEGPLYGGNDSQNLQSTKQDENKENNRNFTVDLECSFDSYTFKLCTEVIGITKKLIKVPALNWYTH